MLLKKRKSGNLCKDQHQNEELSLAPETSIIPMKSWWERASCHKEFRSRRVVAVGVNSIWEVIYVRKIIPPGFIMVLLKESLDHYCCQTNPKLFHKSRRQFPEPKKRYFLLTVLKLHTGQLKDTRVVLKLFLRTFRPHIGTGKWRVGTLQWYRS